MDDRQSGAGLSSTPSPANIVIQTAGGEAQYAFRDIVWNFSSSPIPVTSGSFGASQTPFVVTRGGYDFIHPAPLGSSSDTYVGQGGTPFGTWTLSGSTTTGNWTLDLTGGFSYPNTYASSGPNGGLFTDSVAISSTAHFGASNVVNDVPPQVGQSAPVTITVTAGAADANSPGAVSMTLPTTNTSDVTSVAVQQIPITGITQDAVNAAEHSPIFAAATGDPNATSHVLVWEVSPTGFINDGSQSATLDFHFDPTLFTADELANLGVWHFNTLTQHWDFGGTVHLDGPNSYIEYTTNSFSDFAIASSTAFVPEPSTLVLAGGGLAALACLAAQTSGRAEHRSPDRRIPVAPEREAALARRLTALSMRLHIGSAWESQFLRRGIYREGF